MKTDLLKELMIPISGERLAELYPEYLESILSSCLPNSPAQSLKSISEYFGAKPTINGDNIKGIEDLRYFIKEICYSEAEVNHFSIIAPHTHWDDLQPIIYKFENVFKKYIIGPHVIERDKQYLPVSFIFNEKSLLPFEWADESIVLDQKEFYRSIAVISDLNRQKEICCLPLGIMLDFFFKKSLSEPSYSVVEIPIENISSNYLDFSYIIEQIAFLESNVDLEIEQVAWKPILFELGELSAEQEILLNDIRNLIDKIDNANERMRLIKVLNEELRRF